MDSLAPGSTKTDAEKTEALARRYGAALPACRAVERDHRDPARSPLGARLPVRSACRPGTLETLIAAAQSAATSSNMQFWSAIAVTDPAKRKMLAEIAGNQKHIEQCPLYIAWVADMSRNERHVARPRGPTFESVPWLETFMVACIDAALAAQNAVVAAQSLGLRTVYIGAMRNDPVRVAELLGLPPRAFVVFGLCVGYADPTGQERGQAAPAAIDRAAPRALRRRRPRPGIARPTTPK